MNTSVTSPNLEDVYAALAAAIDEAGPRYEGLLLSKLALLLAHELNDPGRVLDLMEQALDDLDQAVMP